MSRLNDAEPVQKSPEAELGRQSVGDKLSPTEIACLRRQELPDRCGHRRDASASGSIHPQSQGLANQVWLAKVGYERMQEIADPALALERSRENWRKLGRSEKWITQRMIGQETRNKLTDYWVSNEVQQGQEFAILILSPWLRR